MVCSYLQLQSEELFIKLILVLSFIFTNLLFGQTNDVPRGGYYCINNYKDMYIFYREDGSIVFKDVRSLGITMPKTGMTKSGLSVYSSKEGQVRIKYDNGLSKVLTSLNFKHYQRQVFYACKTLTKKNLASARTQAPNPTPKLSKKTTRKKPSKRSSTFSILRDRSEIFKTFGQLSHIKFRPENSPLDFQYDVLYYIPQKLRGKKNLKTLVFLHGGGESTKTRYRSFKVALDYARDLIPLAKKLNFVLILPSGSGLNWSSHLINYMRDLNIKLKEEIEIDPNGIGLAGHSMGGMGITRSAHWLADQYSFFLPIAAGIAPDYLTKENMAPYFNFSYHHLQGLGDHFKVFITRSKKQKNMINRLERLKKKNANYQLEFYKGSHNYPLKRMEELLEDLFKKSSRDLYQKELDGLFYNREEVIDDKWASGDKLYLAKRKSYFWLEALRFSKKKKAVSVNAKIKGQNIDINIDKGLREIRVYLSSKMLDLTKSIKLKVNGRLKYYGILNLNQDLSAKLKSDPGFKFDGYIDVSI